MVTARVAHDVWIKPGKELNRSCGWLLADSRHIGLEQVGRMPIDRDRHEVTGQPRPCSVAYAGPGTPPAREVAFGRRAVRVQVAARDFGQRRIGIHFAPGAQPRLGPDEGHALASRGAEAKETPARDRLEYAAPSGFHRRLNPLGAPLPNLRDQLFTSQGLPAEGTADRVDEVGELGFGDLHPLEPGVCVAYPKGAH